MRRKVVPLAAAVRKTKQTKTKKTNKKSKCSTKENDNKWEDVFFKLWL